MRPHQFPGAVRRVEHKEGPMKIDRRTFLFSLAALAGAGLLTACGSPAVTEPVTESESIAASQQDVVGTVQREVGYPYVDIGPELEAVFVAISASGGDRAVCQAAADTFYEAYPALRQFNLDLEVIGYTEAAEGLAASPFAEYDVDACTQAALRALDILDGMFCAGNAIPDTLYLYCRNRALGAEGADLGSYAEWTVFVPTAVPQLTDSEDALVYYRICFDGADGLPTWIALENHAPDQMPPNVVRACVDVEERNLIWYADLVCQQMNAMGQQCLASDFALSGLQTGWLQLHTPDGHWYELSVFEAGQICELWRME